MRKLNISHSPTKLSVDIGPMGLGLRSGFYLGLGIFIVGFLVFSLFMAPEIFTFANPGHYLGLAAILGVMLIGFLLIAVSWGIAYERQHIMLTMKELKLTKNRKLLNSVSIIIPANKITGFILKEPPRKKYLIGWYAFFFHTSFTDDDLEGYLVPQVMYDKEQVRYFAEGIKVKDKESLVKELEEFWEKRVMTSLI